MRSASRTILTVLVAILVLSPVVAAAQAVPGATADERAINGAKAYMKSKNLTSLKLNMMMPSIFTAGSTGEMANFEKATGIGVNYFEVGILQIQAKAMSEAVAKSGSFDFWIGDPISLPDLVEAGLVRPIDDLAARGKPDFDDVVAGFVEQGRYKGKTYGMFGDGDNWIMVIRKDLIAGKEGVEALKDYIALTKFMPKDILGWATPQAYPFFAGGNAFSIMTYPSIAIAAEHPEKSKIAGKNRYCLVPGYVVNGKLVR